MKNRRHFQLTSSKILTLMLRKRYPVTQVTTPDDFTTDAKQIWSHNNSALVTALKEHADI